LKRTALVAASDPFLPLAEWHLSTSWHPGRLFTDRILSDWCRRFDGHNRSGGAHAVWAVSWQASCRRRDRSDEAPSRSEKAKNQLACQLRGAANGLDAPAMQLFASRSFPPKTVANAASAFDPKLTLAERQFSIQSGR